ncbi:MAG TPA: Chromate resistance protein ChrB [Clostridiaceae bacterium]
MVIQIKWLTFTYKVSNKPSANRVYVWRKLKKIGALPLQDSIFILPYNFKNLEHLQWLSVEIREMDGESFTFESNSIGINKDQDIINKFNEYVESLYEDVFDELQLIKENANDLNTIEFIKLYKAFQEIRKKDYFNSDKGVQIFGTFKFIEKRIYEQEENLDEMDNME